MSSAAIPVILDVDTGVDDAMAILFAVAHPGLDVRAITCVAGNAGLGQVVQNTLAILDLAEAASIPVAAGADRPLIEAARPSVLHHGDSGLGRVTLPVSARTPEAVHAIELLRQQILGSSEPITLITLAPQTNIALLLRTYPEVMANIARIHFMGGTAGVGNATALAEFNVWHDPEAAAIVIGSGVPTTMYGLDVFTEVRVPEQVTAGLMKSDSRLGRTVGTLLDTRAEQPDGSLPYYGLIGDAGAVCALVDPGAFTGRTLPIRVELTGYGRGQTVVDRREYAGEDLQHNGQADWSSSRVLLGVDVPRVLATFFDTLGLAY